MPATVMPETVGWIARFAAFYRGSETISAENGPAGNPDRSQPRRPGVQAALGAWYSGETDGRRREMYSLRTESIRGEARRSQSATVRSLLVSVALAQANGMPASAEIDGLAGPGKDCHAAVSRNGGARRCRALRRGISRTITADR